MSDLLSTSSEPVRRTASVLSRKFVEELAPEERHNLAHGVGAVGCKATSLSPFPSPARAGEGAEGGVRAFEPRAGALG
jgi:hypothetical protein